VALVAPGFPTSLDDHHKPFLLDHARALAGAGAEVTVVCPAHPDAPRRHVVGGIAVISSGAAQGHWRRVDMLWPLGAAVAGSIAALCWRTGIQAFPDTVAGTAVAIFAALVVVAAYTLAVRRERIRENVRVSWKFFIVAGAIEGAGKFLYASALQLGEIYRMLPLIQTSPLFVVLLSLVVLRQAERITWRVPAGAVLTVGGAILVNVRFG